MNFLAHLYLSPSQPDFRVGSFAADGFKGSISSSLPLHLQKGIEAHRALDSFTDNHPVFRESTRLLASGYGKWAGVIADILYDHFLATHWPQLSETPLTTFSKECYSDLNRFLVLLPAVTKRIFPYMIADDWLANYRYVPFLHRVFAGMNRRTQGRAGMAGAAFFLSCHYTELENHFMRFFPEAYTFSLTFNASLSSVNYLYPHHHKAISLDKIPHLFPVELVAL
jgi:acyl carrier protein phosphodiesterase